METVGEANFPKMEESFELEWLMFEDQLHRSLDISMPLDQMGADFHLWSEPSLCEDPWNQLPPFLPLTENSNPNPDHNSFLPFNDQTLSAVVAESLSMKREEKVISGVGEGIKKENNGIKVKMSKIESLQYEEIRKCFDMPISKAAKKLNVGLTVLKKRCRELNIKRWPHRKIKSLKALITNVKILWKPAPVFQLENYHEYVELGMVDVAEVLEEHRRKLQVLPEMELTAETKKLRQACFKANYKKRRAMSLLTN